MPYKNKEDQRRHYLDNKENYIWNVRKNSYGVSKEQFFVVLEKQDNKCALCDKPFESLFKDCHVDHCHDTGRFRGLLCMKCNVGLGMLGDNEEGLNKALSYVKENSVG